MPSNPRLYSDADLAEMRAYVLLCGPLYKDWAEIAASLRWMRKAHALLERAQEWAASYPLKGAASDADYQAAYFIYSAADPLLAEIDKDGGQGDG